ncbi:F-box/kelch-repeat protein [Raphanus sativus]|nr:F-box/kelch-repeat protein [Raphanus sativus]
MISNLPVDLLEEILSRVQVKSISKVRSTCKNWNVLTKDQRFANKHIEKARASQQEKEVLVITGDTNYDLINVKFYDFHNKTFGPSTKSNGILITQQNSDSGVFVRDIFYCNGLLLCVLGNVKLRLLVWNPYWGKTRWIKSPTKRSGERGERFAFGYDKSSRTHKILRLSKYDDDLFIHMDIYDWSSDSWKTPHPDAAFHSNVIDQSIKYTKPGVSLKGNSYWHAKDKKSGRNFLQCFDFTRERFGPRLPIPFEFAPGFYASLSSFREEKLALLLDLRDRIGITVWVTDKIEPDAVYWSKLFRVETLQLRYRGFMFGSFLIDEEKKTVVVFGGYEGCYKKSEYIIDGESGDFRQVERIGSHYSKLFNLVSCYVPSSVQI